MFLDKAGIYVVGNIGIHIVDNIAIHVVGKRCTQSVVDKIGLC